MTAVKWLQMKMATSSAEEMVENINVWFAKAKEMEKEQIQDAWNEGQSNGATICTPKYDNPSEEYYNEKFKSK